MDPLSFLAEECDSVESALNETLRHDYGPEQSVPYFNECVDRLRAIRQAISDGGLERPEIAALMQWLSAIGSRISLIERSHLGEFSWPFAGILRKIACTMFEERTIDGVMKPIVHVVAEGMDYQIVDDDLSKGGLRRIIIVAFPRQLKHHVLIHAIFGHELGHIAYHVDRTAGIIEREVMPLLKRGVLSDSARARTWLDRDDAPTHVRAISRDRKDAAFDEQTLTNWRQEIFCDLFGLRLFGPVFAAAHRTVIEALCPRKDEVDLSRSSHPPYPIRQRIIAQAIARMGWDRPVTPAPRPSHFGRKPKGIGPRLHEAELRLAGYVTECVDDPWFDLFDDAELDAVVAGVDRIFAAFPGTAYEPPSTDVLQALVERLSLERPPIRQSLARDGTPTNHDVPAAHCLYAGWTFWFGRDALIEEGRRTDPGVSDLSFLHINRLCDQALLQQEAIGLMASAVAE